MKETGARRGVGTGRTDTGAPLGDVSRWRGSSLTA